MLNLAHYVQCHPSFRYLRVRHKSTVIVVFLIFLAFFVLAELMQKHQSPTKAKTVSTLKDDELVMLRAQNGYLKHKLAKLQGGPVNTNDKSVPTIYVITPTYKRPVQKAELTRLCHTFLLVANIHWVVIEDAKVTSHSVRDLLNNCGVVYTLLNEPTPPEQKLTPDEKQWSKPRGVHQRNAGLHWIRDAFRNTPPNQIEGVIYFADDDNTYSLELFQEMRDIEKVGVWPVGLVGGLMVERPKVDTNGIVTGWDVTWSPQRPFAIDMAGFAVNVKLFLSKPKAKFAYKVKRGFQESEFLRHLVTIEELEAKADLCTKVLVWHTRAEKVDIAQEKRRLQSGLELSDHNMDV